VFEPMAAVGAERSAVIEAGIAGRREGEGGGAEDGPAGGLD
jgi:hypothetical protein